MANNSRSPRAYVRWVLAAVPLLAGVVIVGLVLALGHGASHSAVAADMTPMPKPSCPIEDPQPFPEAGCDQYDADISYDANDIPELGDQTCSGTGDISVQRGAVYQVEGQDRFELGIFHGELVSTCTPAQTQQTMVVSASEGVCLEQQEGSDVFDCGVILSLNVKTPNLGSFSLDMLPLDCDNVVGGSGEFECAASGPIEIPGVEGATIEGVSLALTSAAEPTPTPPPSPTSPPPPPPSPIGGVGMFSDVGDSSGGNVGVWAGVAAGMAATVVALGGAALYARRRQVQ